MLRHQQKLHTTTTPSSRPRGGRRESTNSLAAHPSGKIRKSSANGTGVGLPGGGPASARRATISHIDGVTLGMLASANRPTPLAHGYANPPPPVGVTSYDTPSMSVATHNHGHHPTLPRLATHNINTADLGGGLRTAPPGQNMGEFVFDQLSFESTINPAQLHLSDSMGAPGPALGGPVSPFTPQPAIMEDDTDGNWMYDFNQMNFHGHQKPNYAHSSSNLMGSVPLDPTQFPFNPSVNPFQDSGIAGPMVAPQVPCTASMPMDNAAGPTTQQFSSMSETVSPTSLHTQASQPDMMYSTPSPLNPVSPGSIFPGAFGQFQHTAPFSPDGTSISSASMSGSARQSSVTSVSTDSITEATRNALLINLSQPSSFGTGSRQYSQPSISSPLSARDQPRPSIPGVSLPGTSDLQRFVGAYIQYFHPHFPFLHVATLCFDTPTYTSNMRATNFASNFAHGGTSAAGGGGGGGCLVLAMSAIGALYEFDPAAARELFEASKKMMQLYLEEQRNVFPTATPCARSAYDPTTQNTPLWLVQAMLLNVIYGHNCGDKVSSDIASTHCGSLLELARSAQLIRPFSDVTQEEPALHVNRSATGDSDVQMAGDFQSHELWKDEYMQWRRWIAAEERKRTLFAIFHMSSLLVSAYNHAPALMNSEIQLDLPCDEELWSAESARTWAIMRNSSPLEKNGIPFTSALSTLLSASQSPNELFRTRPCSQPFGPGMPLQELPQSDLRPSTFGCLILIDALHNYIWETRQRHPGRRWTTQEVDSLQAHLEPALGAWTAAWRSNPRHSLHRPNPFGIGPLSADSVPLLDLAYVRLFVNLGTSKEAFWRRDFEAMAEELARGHEVVLHTDQADNRTYTQNVVSNSPTADGTPVDVSSPNIQSTDTSMSQPRQGSSKRERHLRKAACYAADSMIMSDRLGVTFADLTSRELPIQSALCAFDCAQILAEWVATVQERVGRYMGVLGRDDFNQDEVPAVILLDEQDKKLLEKIATILQNAEAKMTYEVNQCGIGPPASTALLNNLPSRTRDGFGSKILNVTACMMERSGVWPGECHSLDGE